MRPFSKEEMEALKPLESRMRQAKFDYLTSLYSEQKETVRRIYSAAGGTRSIMWDCGACWLAVVKEMGEQYFRQLDETPKEPAKKAAPKKKAPAKKAE